MTCVQKYENILSKEQIEYIFGLSEVENAKKNILEKENGSEYFSIPLTSLIKQSIKEKMNLDLSKFDSIPMRWIKGDIHPHIDNGIKSFKKTHLIYLNDNPGKFIIDNISYPIYQGYGYVFDEGLMHETKETGKEPRLLMGPMSEEGFAVGGATTISANGENDIIYITYISGSGIYGRINDLPNFSLSFPVTIQNTNTSYTLKVLFETDMTFYGSIWYFICGSHNIQFGSNSLNTDGSRPTITIDSVVNYPGFISNGSSVSEGYDNIKIYNLKITTSGGSTLQSDGGWFGQSYFGKNKINNYFINCSSDGPIIDGGGGIVGGYSGESGTLYIIGCSSSGNTGQYSGGIIGFYAGQNAGSVTCESCWSEGIIGTDGGGIFGYYPGISEGHTYANYCYSTGSIGTNAGGIYGAYAGEFIGRNYATGCYSLGNVDANGGGIYGNNAATGSGICSAINCYSNGIITTTGNGIFGTTLGSYIESNCYSSNGSWSSSTADTLLVGVPTSSVIGTTWVATVSNQPYELLNMGYTPYSLNNILSSSPPSLNRTKTSRIKRGESTTSGLISGLSYEILEQSGGGSNITIDSTTGVITTTSSIPLGTYTLYIRNNGSYNITEYTLIVRNLIKKKKIHIFFNNTQGSTTIRNCKNNRCVSETFYWC